MSPEDIKRFEVLKRLGIFLQTQSFVGTASIHTHYWIISNLIAGSQPQVSSRMALIQDLKEKDPQLLEDLMPYIYLGKPVIITESPKKQEAW